MRIIALFANTPCPVQFLVIATTLHFERLDIHLPSKKNWESLDRIESWSHRSYSHCKITWDRLSSMSSGTYQAQSVYHTRSAWLLQLSPQPPPAWLLALLPSQSKSYKFPGYFSGKIPVYVAGIASIRDQRTQCVLPSDRRNPRPRAWLDWTNRILLQEELSGGAMKHNLNRVNSIWVEFWSIWYERLEIGRSNR